MFEVGNFFNDKKEPYTLKISEKGFTAQDYDVLAQKFSELVKYREALPIRENCTAWVKALNKYADKNATLMVVADLTINSSNAMRKKLIRCMADMDRGHYPKGEVMALCIFGMCEALPNFCHSIFKLQHEYIEQ